MKNKICKKIICILLLLSLSIIQVENTSAATYQITVVKYSQEYSQWCWAACAKMIGNYYNHYYTQSSICKYVIGSAQNLPVSNRLITNALQYTSRKNVIACGTSSFSVFVTNIKANRPSVLRMAWNASFGHAYVVSGVTEASGPIVNSLHLIDPIAGHSSGFYSYSKLINGITLASGTGKYTNTWHIG